MCALLLAAWLSAQAQYNQFAGRTTEPITTLQTLPVYVRAERAHNRYTQACE